MAYETKRINSKTFGYVDLEFINDCVTHNSLKNFATYHGIITQTEMVTVDIKNHYWLFKTKALLKKHDTSVQVEEFGEAQDSTLVDEIAKKYPAKMASKRAFDAAIISIICPIGERLYSDSEIPNGFKNAAIAGVPYTPQPNHNFSMSVEQNLYENVLNRNDEYAGTNSENGYMPLVHETMPINGDSTVSPALSVGNYIINFTEKFRGKTLNQIAAESGGMDWIRYMASGRYQSFSEEEAAVIAEAVPQCKSYMDSIGAA